jgi:hypothetical protein
MPAFTPARPKRAETLFFPNFGLGSPESSTYPRGYASGFVSPNALGWERARLGAPGQVGVIDGHFEHLDG